MKTTTTRGASPAPDSTKAHLMAALAEIDLALKTAGDEDREAAERARLFVQVAMYRRTVAGRPMTNKAKNRAL